MKNTNERVMQKSIGLRKRQMEFLDWCKETDDKFDLNEFVRKMLDEQIKQINPKFLEDDRNINVSK